MSKYRIIGNMTGNSMDAVDLVLTEFDGEKMVDICTFSKPYLQEMREKMEWLRGAVFNKTREEIEAIPEFFKIHNDYICGIAECIDEMCQKFGIDKRTVDAIGFHGKTLDHNPPSRAKQEKTKPYTLQMGSGQMLADLSGIKVVYDFRSDFVMAGFEGAPMAAPHNARIAAIEGDGCYFNGGNTANFALIADKKAVLATDTGPFNEYTDNFIRQNSAYAYDVDGMFGKQGQLDKEMVAFLFDVGRKYYEQVLPKSGDPAYYFKEDVFEYVRKRGILFENAVRTFEYFAAYIAVQALSLVPAEIKIPKEMVLFGGGWKNPVVYDDFCALLDRKGFVLPEHKEAFASLLRRCSGGFKVRYSDFGAYMEARAFADMARCRLEGQAWDVPEVTGQKIIAGRIAVPQKMSNCFYDDCLCRAAKGWQREKIKY
ncbi:MAG: anhydro-N-acetylmuramic acid kinase [Alphaproteobacteria bacterium]|nr:anhydro-N-acetylmuramic acid kinase [Alphaproteobacteria bacterium]